MFDTLPGPEEILRRSWKNFSEHLGPMVGAILIMIALFVAAYIVLMGAMFALMYFLRGNQVWFQVANNGITGVFTIAFLWAYIGYARFNLEIMRGAEPNLMTLFTQWRLIPAYLLTNSFMTLVSFVFTLPFMALIAGPVYAVWDKQDPKWAFIVGGVGVLIMIIVTIPLGAAAMVSVLFAIDREIDPVASVVAGVRAMRGNVLWVYVMAILLFLLYIAASVVACTGVGAIVAFPFMTLVGLHCYLALADAIEAELEGEAAPAKAEAIEAAPEAPEGEAPESEAAEGPGGEVGAPVEEPGDNPYAPPAAKVEGPQAFQPADGRPRPQPLPQDAQRYRPTAPAKVTAIAIVCLIPWILAGGNPFSGAFVGFALGRQLGAPDWVGIVAGFGGLTLCGVAAIVVLLLGHRGRREAIVDRAGLAVDGNEFWTGVRLRWDELRGFRISPAGVELYLHGFWGWIWRPVVPTRERETHDLVEKLEAHGIMRI